MHLETIIRALDADIKAVTRAGEHHISAIDRELDGVGIGAKGFAVVVVDGVLARSLAKQVGIGAVVTLQIVIAGAAIQDVTAYITIEGVITRTA